MEGLVRFAVGGAIVSVFAAIGDVLKPKNFPGLFAAAASVAVGSLSITLLHHEPAYAAMEARSMILGAVAMLVYAAACTVLMAIEADFSALRRIKWHEYLTRFVLVGVMTMASGYLAHAFGLVTARLFLAFPAIFPASTDAAFRFHLGVGIRAGRVGNFGCETVDFAAPTWSEQSFSAEQ